MLRVTQRPKSPKSGKEGFRSPKNPHFPPPQKRVFRVKKSPFLYRALQGKWGFCWLGTPFSGVAGNGGFWTPRPSFPDFGEFGPCVKGKRIPKTWVGSQSETGRIRSRRARFRTPSSVSFLPSPSCGERTQWVPLSLLFGWQNELTEFVLAELTEFAEELSEAQWVLFSETVLSKQRSARLLHNCISVTSPNLHTCIFLPSLCLT